MDTVRSQLTAPLMSAWLGIAVCAAALAGCGETPRARAAVHVDSVAPRESLLARFRRGMPVTQRLAGGAATRELLVRRFITALERGDTATLRGLVLDKAEFAFLYYPTNPEALPPYDLEPALMWFMQEGRSRRGLGLLLTERAGDPLGYLSHRCDEPANQQGQNTVWGPCFLMRLQAPDDTITERLFSQIIERDGVFKFVSYANKL